MLFVPTSPFTEKQDFLASHPCGPGADIIHYGSLQDKQKCHFSPGRSGGREGGCASSGLELGPWPRSDPGGGDPGVRAELPVFPLGSWQASQVTSSLGFKGPIQSPRSQCSAAVWGTSDMASCAAVFPRRGIWCGSWGTGEGPGLQEGQTLEERCGCPTPPRIPLRKAVPTGAV